MSRYVVTGTDTGVGKTLVAAGLAGHLRARYWKPVQAGLDEESDSEAVHRLTEGRAEVLPETWRLNTACSPHEAARIDGVRIDPAALVLPEGDGPLIVEGAGGVLVPVNDETLYVDLFAQWGLPVILVARTVLGTINHSLLSLEALRSRGVAVAGIVFSGYENLASEAAIVRFGQVRHLGRLPHLDPVTPASLADSVTDQIHIDVIGS
ncbi:dethiobiotin synthase [Novosphingobium sp. PS1R-30]|uniref:ATP-dependent dethiobiotin synthetase BioD n=1 Tax=Novosphingobium anseongense TaxID=3133436 RepID=A0ABU8S1S9_9SPHN